jgi:hypothetical protein
MNRNSPKHVHDILLADLSIKKYVNFLQNVRVVIFAVSFKNTYLTTLEVRTTARIELWLY